MMLRSLTWAPAVIVAFAAGAFAQSFIGNAYAQTATTATPQVIHLADISSASLPTVVPGVKAKDVATVPSGDVGIVEITNVPRHRHDNTDELIYVIAGTGTATLADKHYDVKAGDLIVLPRGTAHDFQSASGVRVLGIAYPKDDPKDFQAITK